MEHLRLDSVAAKERSKQQPLCNLVHDSHGLALDLGRLEVLSKLVESLLFLNLIDNLVPELEKVDGLELGAGMLESLERSGVGLQGAEARQILSFRILIVANSLFDAPLVVVTLDDVLVRSQPRKDWNLVDLMLL